VKRGRWLALVWLFKELQPTTAADKKKSGRNLALFYRASRLYK